MRPNNYVKNKTNPLFLRVLNCTFLIVYYFYFKKKNKRLTYDPIGSLADEHATPTGPIRTPGALRAGDAASRSLLSRVFPPLRETSGLLIPLGHSTTQLVEVVRIHNEVQPSCHRSSSAIDRPLTKLPSRRVTGVRHASSDRRGLNKECHFNFDSIFIDII